MLKKCTLILLYCTLLSQAKEMHLHEEGNNTAIQIKSVRGILGKNNPIAHARGQIRSGYISFKEDNSVRTNAYALAGHLHFDTKRWHGFEIGASAYTVLNLANRQNPSQITPNFFDVDGNSFAQLTELYLDGKWENTELKLGRQILDTPHADSDDIHMIPNYFEAYTITNTDIDNLILSTGYIRKMAGWENGVNAAKFVNVGKTLGTQNIDGVFYASTSYDGIKDLSLSLWYYHYTDIANVLYAEAGYELHTRHYMGLTI